MTQTVSDHIIQRLYAWGVRTIYGYPGDGINGLIGALDRGEGRITAAGVEVELGLGLTLRTREEDRLAA